MQTIFVNANYTKIYHLEFFSRIYLCKFYQTFAADIINCNPLVLKFQAYWDTAILCNLTINATKAYHEMVRKPPNSLLTRMSTKCNLKTKRMTFVCDLCIFI